MIRAVEIIARALGPAIVGFAVAISCAAAQAPDAYPSRAVQIVCAFPSHSSADVWVRFFAEQASARAGQPMQVENMPGADGNVAAEYVAHAKPDGYTILIHSPTSIAANMFMFKNTPADLTRSLVTIATLFKFASYLVVDSSRPWRNVNDLIAFLRKRNGRVSFAATSPPGRVTGSLFNEALQLQAAELSYKTANDMLYDLQTGRLDFAFTDAVFARAQQREQQVKILAVAAKERMKSDSDIPTLAEQSLAGIDVPGFFGVMVPAGTPRPVIAKINRWTADIVAQRFAQVFINNFGGDPLTTTPDQAQRMFLDAVREWGDLVRRARIKPVG
jgi:tripartite-type tricarboxylate transporter receptor subunit TctC